MKIAIMGDSHDHYENLEKSVNLANENSCEYILFTGDLGAPGNGTEILSKFKGQIKFVLGNNDAEIAGLLTNFTKYGNMELSRSMDAGHTFEGELDGIKIFMNHYPAMAKNAALSGNYNLCIFGHTHKYYEEIINNTLLINPSSIHPYKTNASIIIYNTETKTHEKILL